MFEILVFLKQIVYNRTRKINFLILLITKQFSKEFKFYMTAQFLPSILVPLVGLVFPAVAMASMFLYIEKEEIY